MTRTSALVSLVATVLASGACSSLGSEMPDEPPPLASMEEPPALFDEPADEELRTALPLGGYTGVHVSDGRTSLGGLVGGDAPNGVLVQRVIENSPGAAAGIVGDDLIVAARRAGGAEIAIRWPSEWRLFERTSRPGEKISVVIDRAGVDDTTEIVVAARVRAAKRLDVERFREEDRVGVVLRTATQAEARSAGLGAGGGAVIVGLAAESPWRQAGLRFGDIVKRVGSESVAHPQVVLNAIREADAADRLALQIHRGGSEFEIEALVSRREQDTRRVSIPLIYSYGAERGESETSILLGLFKKTTTKAAWEWRILWFISFGGGDADRLEDVR